MGLNPVTLLASKLIRFALIQIYYPKS